MKTVLETIQEISEPIIKKVMETPGDEWAIRLAIKEAAIDGYSAGQRDAHESFNESLDNLEAKKRAKH